MANEYIYVYDKQSKHFIERHIVIAADQPRQELSKDVIFTSSVVAAEAMQLFESLQKKYSTPSYEVKRCHATAWESVRASYDDTALLPVDHGKMRLRKFGRTGKIVSEVGVGTWTMGGRWGNRDDDQAVESLKFAMQCGVSFIDTAWVYGNGLSEQLIGRAIRESGQQPFVATKVPPLNMQWPAKPKSSSKEAFPAAHVIEYTEKSLRNLQIDCVDLQQLHVWTDEWVKEPVWLDAIDKLKSAGKIKHFGISLNAHEANNGIAAVKSGLVDSVQVVYNIFDQSAEQQLFSACEEHGVAVIARVPFDEGSLTGKLTPDMKFAKDDWRRFYFAGSKLKEACQRADKLKALLPTDVKNLAQLALMFCLSHPAVSTVIPGMRTTAHVKENCAAGSKRHLNFAELEELKKHAWDRDFYPRAPGWVVRILSKFGLKF